MLGLNNNRLGCLPNNLDSLTSLQVLAICDQHDAFHVQHVIPFKSMPNLLRIDLRQEQTGLHCGHFRNGPMST